MFSLLVLIFQLWTGVDAVGCLAVQLTGFIRRNSHIKYNLDIQLDKYFTSVWAATEKSAKEYENVPKKRSP